MMQGIKRRGGALSSKRCMMLKVVALVVCLASFGSARRSPYADLVEEFFKNNPEASRYSNNLLEDALLDVPGLITKYGYPVEVYKVMTDDGYILEVQRIPHGRDAHNVADSQKPVVFVMHGLFSSSADFVLMGPGSALAYILAEAGYDVWLGNARGTYYSREHVTLNPDGRNSFWRFSWDEIGALDLTAMIDYALQVSGKSRLHYIGHSQGTTSFFAMASLRPEYNDKIITMQAFAPVAYMENNENPLIVGLAPHADNIETAANLAGVNELLPNTPLFTWLGEEFCKDGAQTQPLCIQAIYLLGGPSEGQLNATMFPVKLGHTPAGAAVRQLVHYGQLIRQNFFRRYDHGTLTNWITYGSLTPPSYDLQRITAPVYLHYVDHDVFAHVLDVERLYAELGQPAGMFRVPHDHFSHVDFMWGIGAKELLYDRTIDLMNAAGTD